MKTPPSEFSAPFRRQVVVRHDDAVSISRRQRTTRLWTGGSDKTPPRHKDRIRRSWRLKNDNIVAARLQGGDQLLRQRRLDEDAIWHPLIMHPRRRNGVRDIHLVIDHIDQDLEHGADDPTSTW